MKKNGFAILEIVVSIAVSAMLLVSFMTLAIQTKKVGRTYTSELQAQLYLAEIIESAKDLEKSNWNEIADGSCGSPAICRPEISAGLWIFETGSEALDNGTFTRSLSVFEVQRNTLTFPNEIVESGGVVDPDTKKIIGAIYWNDGYNDRVLNLETYVYKP